MLRVRNAACVCDLAGDDLGLQVFHLGLQLSRHGALQIVEWGDPYSRIGQVANIHSTPLEAIVHGGFDHVIHRVVHVLHHAGQHDVLRLGEQVVAINVNPDAIAAPLSGNIETGRTDQSTHRDEDVHPFVEQQFGGFLALGQV